MTQTIDNPIWFRKAVEQRLRDISITTCYNDLTSRGICSTYKLYKETYGNGRVSSKLNKCNRKYVTKLCTGNNQLLIISGRHPHINREDWCCTKCNDRQTGEEYHVYYSVETKILFS